jgi:hypothetical protein
MSYGSDNVLYFPSIEVRSPSWLKASLLVWDYIYRIVPPGYEPRDSREVRIAVDAGLLRDISLEDADRDLAYREFSRMIAMAPFLADGFSERGEVAVHTGKIDERLQPLLEDVSVLLKGDWYEMPKGLAWGYMLALARKTAQRRGMCVATDNPDAWTAAAYLDAGGNMDESLMNDDDEERYCHVLINDLLPLNLTSVPMDAIVHVRDKHDDERRALRNEIARVMTSLTRCESAEYARHLQANAMKALEKRKESYRRGMKSYVGDFINASLIVGVPTTLTALSTFGMSDPNDLKAIGSALLIGSVAALADSGRARSARRVDQIGSYLVEVESESRVVRIPHFPRLMNEFVND